MSRHHFDKSDLRWLPQAVTPPTFCNDHAASPRGRHSNITPPAERENIGGGSRTGKLIKHWFALRRSDLMQHERAPRSRRWPEIRDSITAVHACGKGATAEFENSGLGFPAILSNENESDTCGKIHKE